MSKPISNFWQTIPIQLSNIISKPGGDDGITLEYEAQEEQKIGETVNEKQIVEENRKEQSDQPTLKMSEFLTQKDRHNKLMEFVNQDEELLKIFNDNKGVLQMYIKLKKIDQINKKLSEIVTKYQNSKSTERLIKRLKNQDFYFEDDLYQFETLNDGQLVAIQLFFNCVIHFENLNESQIIQQLINPYSMQQKQKKNAYQRLQNLEKEEKFKNLSGDNFQQFKFLKI